MSESISIEALDGGTVAVKFTPGSRFAAVLRTSTADLGYRTTCAVMLQPDQLRALALELVKAATLIEAPQ